ARVTRSRHERLPFNPAPQQRGNVIELDRRSIEAIVSIAERSDRRQHRTPGPKMSGPAWIVAVWNALVALYKVLENCQVLRHPAGRTSPLEVAGKVAQHMT